MRAVAMAKWNVELIVSLSLYLSTSLSNIHQTN